MYLKKIFFYLIFCFVFILYLPYIINSFHGPLHPYVFSDLHINYVGGFIRRGLLGELARIFNPLIGNIQFFAIIFTILYFIQILLFFKLLKKYEHYLSIIIFLCLSPALLMFFINFTENFMRRDVFFNIAIMSHSLILIKYNSHKLTVDSYYKIQKLFIIPFLAINILIHELQFFFISIHILLSYLFYNKNIKNFFKSKIFKIYLLLLIPFTLIIFNPGEPSQIEEIKKSLSLFQGVTSQDPFNALYGNINLQLGLVLKSFYHYDYLRFIKLFFAVFFSLFLFILLFHYLFEKKIIKIKNSSLKIYPLFFLPCFLIFIAGSDFGRWINIICFHLLSFYFTLNINKNIKLNLYNFPTNILIPVLLFAYVFLWTLPEGFMWGQKFFYSSLFNNIYDLILSTYSYINLNIIELPLNNFKP
tara:strand:+ start:1098 stop:2348 length:1251 start_codon:yes stop_codon:yes gene_type:complete